MKITIERETLERAMKAIELRSWNTTDEEAAIVAMRAALAAQPAEPVEPVACKGIPRKGCNYLAYADTVCNKCGEIHHHHQMLAHFYAAPPPAAVPPGYALVPIEPTLEMCRAGRIAEISATTHLTQPVVYRAMIAAVGERHD